MAAVDVVHSVTTRIRDWLVANRPAGLPASITVNSKTKAIGIVALVADRTTAERPVVVLEAAVGNWMHPHLVRVRLRVRLLTQQDDSTAANEAAWMYAVVDALRENEAALQTELRQDGYWLRRVYPGSGDVSDQGERGAERWQDLELTIATKHGGL